MDQTQIAYELMKSAVCGVSKTQTLKYIKEIYNQSDEQLTQLLELCNFRSPPNKIDYEAFASRPFPAGTNQFDYPFTQIYEYKNFLTQEECQALIAIADSTLRPSTVSNHKDEVITSNYRTSSTSDLHYFNSPYLNYIDNKIANFLGLYHFLGETLQAQKYSPGQYYKEHCDYFYPSRKEYKTYTEWMGQRTWTFMVYLNDVEEGGETYFKRLKLNVKPEQGKAIFWNNLYRNGTPNPKTIHEATPPKKGNKYVITKWWRSWPLI